MRLYYSERVILFIILTNILAVKITAPVLQKSQIVDTYINLKVNKKEKKIGVPCKDLLMEPVIKIVDACSRVSKQLSQQQKCQALLQYWTKHCLLKVWCLSIIIY